MGLVPKQVFGYPLQHGFLEARPCPHVIFPAGDVRIAGERIPGVVKSDVQGYPGDVRKGERVADDPFVFTQFPVEAREAFEQPLANRARSFGIRRS